MDNVLPNPTPAEDAVIVAKAFFRASAALNLSQREISGILGRSEATISRLLRNGGTLDPNSKEGEIALLFLRFFRSLDALFGGREADMRAWFDAPNTALNGVPRDQIQSLQGLFGALHYLDAMRGPV